MSTPDRAHIPPVLKVTDPVLGEVELVDCTNAGLTEGGNLAVDVTLAVDGVLRTVRVAIPREQAIAAYNAQEERDGS